MNKNVERKITEIEVGAEKPFSFFHVSDTHLALADERDDERKNKLAQNRKRAHFEYAEEHLAQIERMAKGEGKTVVHTGDLIDFVSALNLDRAREFTESVDVLMAAGNHEFSLYVGEAFEDAAYRAQSFDRVQAVFQNSIRFASRVVNGVNLVVVDNSYYFFDDWQLEALKVEVQRGLPILLFMHTPIYNEVYRDFLRTIQPEGAPLSLMAAPEEELGGYSEYRYRQQKADAVTYEAAAYIREQPLIKAVFTGHIHKDFEAPLGKYAMQYTTGIGTVREILIR